MSSYIAKLFGGISFKSDGKELLNNKKKLPKHVELLAILLTYHDQQLTTANLSTMLWEDKIEDPPAALKNCVYNLRKTLSVKGEKGKNVDFILTEGGRYRWNDAVKVDCDMWTFQDLVRKATREKDVKKKMSLFRELINVYPNEFLGGTHESLWAIQEAERVRQQYIDIVVELCSLLCDEMTNQSMREVLGLCNRAAFTDPMADEIYIYMYRAMSYLGMNNAIRENYPKLAEFFKEELVMDMYPEITSIYEQSCDSHLEASDVLDNIVVNLASVSVTSQPTRGAFICHYDTFKQMFRLRFMSDDRTDDVVALILITLLNDGAKEELYERISGNMEDLKEVLRSTLRKGDVISRYSGNQYIAMVVIKQESDVEHVKARLRKAFDRDIPNVEVRMESTCSFGQMFM